MAKKEHHAGSLQNRGGPSWPVVITVLIFIWPVGIFLLWWKLTLTNKTE
jgi:DNA-binding transcriptional regulator of glucitol operon